VGIRVAGCVRDAFVSQERKQARRRRRREASFFPPPTATIVMELEDMAEILLEQCL
jgi:hypothetical protein